MREILLLVAIVATSFYAEAQIYTVSGPLQQGANGPLLYPINNGATNNAAGNIGTNDIHQDNSFGTGNTWSNAIQLTFPFDFFGVAVDSFCVSKNRLLTFDPSLAGTTVLGTLMDNSNMPNADLPDNTIAWNWGNFANGTPTLGTNDHIYMQEFGTAPNRQLWIKAFSYEIEGTTFSYNCVVLEETTNRIYVVDMYNSTANAGGYTIGVQKDNLIAVEDPASPNNTSITTSFTFTTANNYWVFTPFNPQPNDAVLETILEPSGTIGCEGDFDVICVVKNNGPTTLNNIPVTATVGATTLTGTTANPIGLLGTDTVNLGTVNLTGSGNGTLHDFTFYTTQASDPNLNNDTMTTSITVYGNTPFSITDLNDYPINNTLAPVTATVVACGMPILDTCLRVKGVYIDTLMHTWNNDIDMFLISPSGTVMELSTDNGGSTDNMIGVHFTRTATTPILNAPTIPPGDYLPEEANGFDVFSGEDPNGGWTLQITDDTGGDNGTLMRWTLAFENVKVDLGLDTVVCANEFTLNPGPQFSNYSWQDGSTNQTFTVSDPGTQTYSISTTDALGICSSVDDIVVSIGHEADLGEDRSLCAGSTFTFELGPAFSSAVWQDNSTALTYTASAVETIIVDATDSLGCSTMDTVIIQTVHPVTPIDFGADQELCDGEYYEIEAPTNFVSYIWEGVNPAGSSRVVFTSGLYSLVATDANGCTSADDIEVTFHALPFIDDGLGSPQGTSSFEALPGEIVPYFSQTYPSMTWSVNGDNTNSGVWTDIPSLEVVTNLHGYTITLTVEDDNECVNEGVVKVYNYPVGIDDPTAGNFSLFPNPTNGRIILKNSGNAEQVELQLVSIEGKTVFSNGVEMIPAGGELQLDFSGISSGLYLLNIMKEDETEQVRVVID